MILSLNVYGSVTELYFRYIIINLGIIFLYYTSYHEVDEEEYGGHGELAKEGLLTSFSLFLVGLIISCFSSRNGNKT